jgi:outer membrane protein, heavy metal efflux system
MFERRGETGTPMDRQVNRAQNRKDFAVHKSLIFRGLIQGSVLFVCLFFPVWGSHGGRMAMAGDVDPAPPAELAPRTEDELVQLALEHNPTIQATIADVNRARGLRWQVTRKPNPFVGYSASEVANEGRAGQQGMYVSQEIVTANKLGLNDQVAGWEVEQFNRRWQEQQLRVTGNVRQLFYAVLAARQRRDILRQLDEVLARGVEITRQLVESGEIGRGPLLQARLERQQNQLNLRNAERDLTAAQQALATTIGLPDLNLEALSGQLDSDLPVLEFESTWQGVIGDHPRIAATRAEQARHQWNIRRQQAEPIPNVHSMFQVQHDDVTNTVIAGIQVGVQLPVHNRNRGQIAAANADSVRASHELHRRELELRHRFVEAHRQYAVARQQVETLQEELLPLARDNLETIQELFRLGESSYLDLLTAQRTYIETILALIDARRDAWQAVVLINSRLMTDALSSVAVDD